MSKLVAVPNVWNSSLLVLRSRGYTLSAAYESAEGIKSDWPRDHVTWVAEKDGYSLFASNPTELLGLAGAYEHKVQSSLEPYWWLVPGDDALEELYSSVGLGMPEFPPSNAA